MVSQELLNYFSGDELAASTWMNKYAYRDEKTPVDMHRRMAKEFARIEKEYDNPLDEEEIFDLFDKFKYIIPGGSVMAVLGTDMQSSLSNCSVIASPEDSISGIMDTAKNAANLFKRRFGVGFDISTLRPDGAAVNNSAKYSTGAASFMDLYSNVTNTISQKGRRGALMLTISINHPDVLGFITKKQDLTKVTGANISVKVTDEFMKAVERDEDYYLRYPVDQDLSYFSKDYLDVEYNKLTYLEDHRNNNKIFYIKKVKAKELWNILMHCAWNTAEPGIIFEDKMINYAPDGVYPQYKMVSTNPCGEIGMGQWDSCRLIHINLTSFVDNPFKEDSTFDYNKLAQTAYKATKLADDLVDLEIEALEKIKSNVGEDEQELIQKFINTGKQTRRLGVGFTGLADTLAMLNISFSDSFDTVEQIMSTMFEAELEASINMAIERGPFKGYDQDLENEVDNKWNQFIRVEFNELYKKMQTHGRRNISFSTVAPTGTVSLLARCSSGIEPIFLPYYTRRRKVQNNSDRVDFIDVTGQKFTNFKVVHPNLTKCLNILFPDKDIYSLTDKELDELISKTPYAEQFAGDIDWHKRVKLQGIVQKYITHSISSTINLPEKTTEDEIADIYIEAWKAGNKGQTIYRQGCRDGVLVDNKDAVKKITSTQAPKRGRKLVADYYETKIKGETFIVLVGLMDGRPYEIFAFRPNLDAHFPNHQGIIVKQKKMHYMFTSDKLTIPDLQLANENIEERAATLYSSMLLRHGVDIKYIVKTAKKVNDNITSFSSAMCRILSKYIEKEEVKGEVCPECGGKLIRENGCLHCQNCSWSRCG